MAVIAYAVTLDPTSTGPYTASVVDPATGNVWEPSSATWKASPTTPDFPLAKIARTTPTPEFIALVPGMATLDRVAVLRIANATNAPIDTLVTGPTTISPPAKHVMGLVFTSI